jgi:hypothetical protein
MAKRTLTLLVASTALRAAIASRSLYHPQLDMRVAEKRTIGDRKRRGLIAWSIRMQIG